MQEKKQKTQVVPSANLELATKSMMHIQILISPLNQLQCLYLLDKLCETLNDAKACIHGLPPQDIERTHHILENLARTAKEVEILVGDCCDAQWIQSAMILANAKEHFASLAFKLRLNMQLLQSIFKEGATEKFLTKLQDPTWSDYVKDEEFLIIDEKAKKDQQQLLSRLTEVGSSASKNLIKRLEISSNRATFLKHNGSSVFDAWKVGYKSIQRVQNGQLGKGSSATMHKVTWLGKQFAEKCFHAPDNEYIQEAYLLARLSHPNILPLFCYTTGDHRRSLVMELMDEDLHSLMTRRLGNEETLDAPFKLLEAIDIMLQVAEGMSYLHQNRVIHQGLKSMKILVKCNEHDRHVCAKVGDFRFSKVKESSYTYSGLTMDVGTTRWMAPELFTEEFHNAGPSVSRESYLSLKYPFKVDIYSFRMVCYEILTGCIPFFDCPSMSNLRKRIKDGLRPDIPERCPKKLGTLIQACYHSNPTIRPSFPKICVELRHIMCSLMVDSVL
jgi:hypothetical protein